MGVHVRRLGTRGDGENVHHVFPTTISHSGAHPACLIYTYVAASLTTLMCLYFSALFVTVNIWSTQTILPSARIKTLSDFVSG